MWLALYNLLLHAASPLLRRKLRLRAGAEPLYAHAQHQRFARYSACEQEAARAHAGQWLWLHAVSLGETQAAALLLAELRRLQPALRLLLTSGTATGWAQGEKLLRAGDMHLWLPWDTRAATRRFVQCFQPRLGLLMETEVWPQLLRACQENGTPVALVNARMSEKSLRQSLRFKPLAYPAYRSLAAVYAQTPQDAQRLRQLQPPHIQVCGNVKFDARPDPGLLQQGRALRQQWQDGGPRRPVAVLASSREGEEALWLRALQALPQQEQHAVQWLLVPRHPQRFDAVAQALQQAQWRVRRRSQHPKPAARQDDGRGEIWLGDSMGEMPLYYAMADWALMGGSFEPLGGQNLIEACACGCGVLLGPHTFNFAQASEQAIAAGAALRCAHMAQALQHSLHLSAAPGQLQALRAAATHFAASQRGSARAIAHALQARGWI